MAYKTVYQGSARGPRRVGGTQGTPVKQEIVAKAQAISSDAASVTQDYGRVIGQATAEAQRQDKIQTFNENKSLSDLKELNRSINNFFMTGAKTVGRDYVAEKRQQGIDLVRRYNAGDLEAKSIIDGDESQLRELEAKVNEHAQKVDKSLSAIEQKAEIDGHRATLQEQLKAQNIRKLGSNVRFGYIRGTLMEAGKNYGEHLHNSLVQSDEIIPGTNIRVGDYYDIEDTNTRQAIINYVEDQYIANNNPWGANEKAVRTYLTKTVVATTDKFQELEVVRTRREQAIAEEEDLNNNLETALGSFEDDNGGASIAAVQKILNLGSSIKNRQGIQGSSRTATKEWILKQIPDALSRIKDDGLRTRIIDELSTHKFTIPGLGTKTFNEHWGNDWVPDEIKAKAEIVAGKRYQDRQIALKWGFKGELGDLKQQIEDGQLPQSEYTKTLNILADKYDGLIDIQTLIKNEYNWTPRKLTLEQSKTFANEILSKRHVLTEQEAGRLDKGYAKVLRDQGKIISEPFGDIDDETKKTRLAGVKELNQFVTKIAEVDVDKNSILSTDITTTQTRLAADYIKNAKAIFDAGGYQNADGQFVTITSQGEALRHAIGITKEQFEKGNSIKNHRYELTAEGFVNAGTPGTRVDLEPSKAIHRAKTIALDKLANDMEGTSNDLIASRPLKFITNEDLTPQRLPDNSLRLSPSILQLAELDALNGVGTRDGYEILNTIRAKRGLPLWTDIPEGVERARIAKNTSTKEIQKRIAETLALGDTKGFNEAHDAAGGVNLSKMQSTYVNADNHFFTLGPNLENLSSELVRAGLKDMTKEEFLNDSGTQTKLHKFLVNDMMLKAEALTNNKQEMIRMTAVGLRFGEEAMSQMGTNKEYADFGAKAQTRYHSGAQFPDSEVINAVSENDYMITRIGNYETHRTIISPDQRSVLSVPIPTDLKGMQEQLLKMQNIEPPRERIPLKPTQKGFMSRGVRDPVSLKWETRMQLLKNRITVSQYLRNWGGQWSERERIIFARALRGAVGDEQYKELTNSAYQATGASSLNPLNQEYLLNLVRAMPEFGLDQEELL